MPENWVRIGETSYPYTGEGYYETNKTSDTDVYYFYLKFEVDEFSATPTSIKCKYTFRHTKRGTGYYTDFFYLYFPSTGANYLLHHGGADVNTTYNYQRVIPKSGTFTLTKKASATSFTLPAFWICNQGRVGTLGTFKKSYFESGGSRVNYCSKYSKISHITAYATQLTGGSLKLDDNNNNTYTLTITEPTGTRNSMQGEKVYYYYSNTEVTDTSTIKWNKASYDESYTYTIPSNKGPNPWIYFQMTYKDEYGLNYDALTASTQVRLYQSPIPFGKYSRPTITPCQNSGEPSSKIVPNGSLKLEWNMGEQRNGHSPVTSCRVYFFIKKSGEDKWKSYGTKASTLPDTKDQMYSDMYYYEGGVEGGGNLNDKANIKFNDKEYTVDIDHENKKCTMVLPCKDFGLKKGDKCKVWISTMHSHKTGLIDQPYFWALTEYNDTNEYQSSEEHKVESSGTVNVHSSTKFVEGHAYVHNATEWIEASSIYIHTGSEWEESI